MPMRRRMLRRLRREEEDDGGGGGGFLGGVWVWETWGEEGVLGVDCIIRDWGRKE